MSRLTISQIKAVCYADMFDYPLGLSELRKFEIRNSKYETCLRGPACRIGGRNSIKISRVGHYLTLPGREALVPLRQQRERCSRAKLSIAQKVCQFLRCIPTVQMIAVSGSVAMLNADEDDDIDIMVIAKTGWLWTTRFLVVIVLDMLGVRRRPGRKNIANTLCANMFIDEAHMMIPEKERDIFSAHEVAQARVLWERGNTAENFYRGNEWITEYLPKFETRYTTYRTNSSYRTGIPEFILTIVFFPLEGLFQFFQLAYMRSKRTNEVILPGYLRFHPGDVRIWVLREYTERLRQFGLE